MSRLKRWLLSGKIFFITTNLHRTRLRLTDPDFARLAETFRGVRKRRGFLLAGYVFMPDHWHVLLVPRDGDTLDRLMDSLKVAAMRRINSRRGRRQPLWQPRYFDEIIRTAKQYRDTLQYMHFNPVEKGLVSKPEDWPWSSYRWYQGRREVPLEIDPLDLPADEKAPL